MNFKIIKERKEYHEKNNGKYLTLWARNPENNNNNNEYIEEELSGGN